MAAFLTKCTETLEHALQINQRKMACALICLLTPQVFIVHTKTANLHYHRSLLYS